MANEGSEGMATMTAPVTNDEIKSDLPVTATQVDNNPAKQTIAPEDRITVDRQAEIDRAVQSGALTEKQTLDRQAEIAQVAQSGALTEKKGFVQQRIADLKAALARLSGPKSS